MLLTMFETYISRCFSVAFIEMVTFNRKQVTTLFLKIRHQILAIKCKTIAHWYAHSSIHFYLQSNDLHIEGNVSYIMAVYIYCSNVALFVNKLSRLLCNRECVMCLLRMPGENKLLFFLQSTFYYAFCSDSRYVCMRLCKLLFAKNDVCVCVWACQSACPVRKFQFGIDHSENYENWQL